MIAAKSPRRQAGRCRRNQRSESTEYDKGRANASILQFLLAEQLDAFLRYDMPWPLTRQMLSTPPWDMYWITERDIEVYNLNRSGSRGGHALRTAAPQLPERDIPLLSFADFPPDTVLAGDPRLPDFNGRDEDFRMYRTRIGAAAAGGVTFAGHYSMVEIGCGTSCRFAFAVDLETGEVGSFPYGGEEQYGMGLLYSPDSRLLKVRWENGLEDETCVEKDMIIDGLEWQELAERIVPAVDNSCSHDT